MENILDAGFLNRAADVDFVVPGHEVGHAVAVPVRDVRLTLGHAVRLQNIFESQDIKMAIPMSCLKLIYNYKNVHFYAVLKLSMPRLNDTKWPYLGTWSLKMSIGRYYEINDHHYAVVHS